MLVIRFLGKYDPGWIEEMKTYGKCYYDFRRREWLLQWSKLTCDSLADYFSGMRIPVNVKKQVINEELIAERKDTGEKVKSRAWERKLLTGLIRWRCILMKTVIVRGQGRHIYRCSSSFSGISVTGIRLT